MRAGRADMNSVTDRLCYLEASQVLGPAGRMAALDVRTRENEPLGSLAGVLVDPLARKLRFFVVVSSGPHAGRRYLLPADVAPTVDAESHALRLELTPEELSRLPEFDTSRVRAFTEEDAIAPTLHRYLSEVA